MTTLLFLAHLLVAPLAFAGGSAAPPPPPSSGMGGGGGGGEDAEMDLMANFSQVASDLGLDQGQQSKIRDLFYNSQKEAIDLRAAAQRTELDLRHHMGQDTPDEKAVMKALDAHLAAEAALKRNRVQLMLDVRDVLSVEQWRELLELRASRGRMGGGMGHGGGMGPGQQQGPGGGQ